MGTFNISITKIQRALETSVSEKGSLISEMWSIPVLLVRTDTNQILFSRQIRVRKWNSTLWYFLRPPDLHQNVLLLHYINKFLSLTQFHCIWVPIRHSDRHTIHELRCLWAVQGGTKSIQAFKPNLLVVVSPKPLFLLVSAVQLTGTLKSTLHSPGVRPSSYWQEGLQGCKVPF